MNERSHKPGLLGISQAEGTRMREVMAVLRNSGAMPPEAPPYRDPVAHELATGMIIPRGKTRGAARISKPY